MCESGLRTQSATNSPEGIFLCRKFSICLNTSCNECEYCIPINYAKSAANFFG